MDINAAHISDATAPYSKVTAYIKLGKFRLASLVVFSAIITYLTIAEEPNWATAIALCAGGFLVTAAANGYNQIIEKDLDRLMERTRLRPLPLGILKPGQAFIFCTICGVLGTVLLWLYTNPLCGILGFASILLYAVVYTPLKRITPVSVFVGAFPGALPTLIGGVAATTGFGSVSFFAFLLFMIQFVWQFPHFWSLAWFNNDDYARADFHLLPSRGGKDDFSKFQVLLYCAFLLVVGVLPFAFGMVGILCTLATLLCGFAILLQGYNFYRMPTDSNARRLFLGTLVYLPLVQLALMTKS